MINTGQANLIFAGSVVRRGNYFRIFDGKIAEAYFCFAPLMAAIAIPTAISKTIHKLMLFVIKPITMPTTAPTAAPIPILLFLLISLLYQIR